MTAQGKEITFHQEKNGVCHGFPYIDMHSTNAVVMIQTICQWYEGFTKCKVQDATAACKAQAMTGHPTDAQFLKLVRNNSIKNCPVKPDHITNAHSIFGPSIAGVRGRTTRQKPERVEAAVGCILDDFHCLHKFVVLTADMMFVNGMAFLTTLSRKLQLATVEQLPSHTATQLSNSLIKIVKIRSHRLHSQSHHDGSRIRQGQGSLWHGGNQYHCGMQTRRGNRAVHLHN
jgi:hypothetical protein